MEPLTALQEKLKHLLDNGGSVKFSFNVDPGYIDKIEAGSSVTFPFGMRLFYSHYLFLAFAGIECIRLNYLNERYLLKSTDFRRSHIFPIMLDGAGGEYYIDCRPDSSSYGNILFSENKKYNSCEYVSSDYLAFINSLIDNSLDML